MSIAADCRFDHTVWGILTVFALLVLYLIGSAIYNLYFHPLSQFKGPKFWCASRLGFINSLVRGNLVRDVRKLHEKYGDIVRLAPNELSFARKDAWHDVFSKRPGHKAFPKNPIFFKAPPGQPENMITTSNAEDHARMRKLLAPAFTQQAVAKQEPIIQYYADLLIEKLKLIIKDQESKAGKSNNTGVAINMVRWYNFCTFDIVGDLGFGEPFGSLASSEYHPWVALIFNFLKGMTLAAATRFYPVLEFALIRMLPAKFKKMQREHYQITVDKVHRRMNLEKERDDLMTPVLENNSNFENMSLEEIESTFALLTIAGSEATATTLCGITNELVKAPLELEKLVREIRETFENQSEITSDTTRELPFLNAVIQEGLRFCNPVPAGLPRLVPEGGDTVCGYFLPEYTNVIVNPTAISFSKANFTRPDSFLADRFLPESLRPSEFSGDQIQNQYPFGLGPRSCLGKIVALTEMRLILAKMVWNFDIEASPCKTLDWLSQKTFIIVQKEPVEVRLRMRT